MATAGAIRAGRAFVELFADDSKLVRGLRLAEAKIRNFGKSITGIGSRLATLGAAVLSPLVGASALFAKFGDSLGKASERTGVGVEQLSALAYAAEQSATDLETLETAMRNASVTVVKAAGGSEKAAAKLRMVGLAADDLAGLSPDQQLLKIADAIAAIEDPGRKSAAALAIFGKQGAALLPLVANGAAGINDLTDRARKLGIVLSKEQADAATKLDDAWDDLKKTFRGASLAIGAALAPDLTELANAVRRNVKMFVDWLRENKALIVAIAKTAATVFVVGTALIFLGKAIGGLAGIFGSIISVVMGTIGVFLTVLKVIGSIAAFLGPVGALVVGLGVAFVAYAAVTSVSMDDLKVGFLGLRDTAITAFGGIADALAAGDISLAGKVLWLALKAEWVRGIGFLNEKWQEWKSFFLEVWNQAVSGTAGLMIDAWAQLQAGWVETTNFLADVWYAFAGVVIDTWTGIQKMLSKGLLTLTKFSAQLAGTEFDLAGSLAALEEESAAQKSGRENARNKATLDREAARNAARRRIEEDRQGAQDALTGDRDAESRRIQAQQAAANAEADNALAAARREFADAVAAAKAKRAQVEADDRLRGKQKIPKAADLADEGEAKLTAAGTFNPFAVGGLGGSDLSEIRKATRETADALKRLRRVNPEDFFQFGNAEA